jgi:hypothetical protein
MQTIANTANTVRQVGLESTGTVAARRGAGQRPSIIVAGADRASSSIRRHAQMIELLELGVSQGWDRLRVAVEQSLSMGCHVGAAIRHLPTAEQLKRPMIAAIEIGHLARYDRPLPVMTG